MADGSMKLIIQIPCFNEGATLALALDELPKTLPGIDRIEYLIIDDGSTDNTVEVARKWGVHYIVRHNGNRGLAKAFMSGLKCALKNGADIIVNTDADNQYCAQDMDKLIEPILSGRAQYVIGTRPIVNIAHFSPLKKLLQRFGSWMVRVVSGTRVEDAPSGFRAMSREAALQLNVFNNYTYTLETIIQAGNKNIPLECVPVRVNEDLRPSRLVKSIPAYIRRSIITMLRICVVYKPFKFFLLTGTVLFVPGILLGIRFLVRFLQGSGQGMTQSLILAAVLLLMGTIAYMMAFVADLLSVNRMLLEDIQYQLRKKAAER